MRKATLFTLTLTVISSITQGCGVEEQHVGTSDSKPRGTASVAFSSDSIEPVTEPSDSSFCTTAATETIEQQFEAEESELSSPDGGTKSPYPAAMLLQSGLDENKLEEPECSSANPIAREFLKLVIRKLLNSGDKYEDVITGDNRLRLHLAGLETGLKAQWGTLMKQLDAPGGPAGGGTGSITVYSTVHKVDFKVTVSRLSGETHIYVDKATGKLDK